MLKTRPFPKNGYTMLWISRDVNLSFSDNRYLLHIYSSNRHLKSPVYGDMMWDSDLMFSCE